MTTIEIKHEVDEENALRFLDWIRDRGGVAVWKSLDLSDPGFSLSTPALTDGAPTKKPHWKVGDTPSFVVTDASEIQVNTYVKVKQFHVGIRRGSQGLSYKLTDAASRRVHRELKKAGDGATYQFDYDCQDAVILKAVPFGTLADWATEHDAKQAVK